MMNIFPRTTEAELQPSNSTPKPGVVFKSSNLSVLHEILEFLFDFLNAALKILLFLGIPSLNVERDRTRKCLEGYT